MRTKLIAALASIGLIAGAAVVPPAQSAPGGAGQPARSQEPGGRGRAGLDDMAERLERTGRPAWVPGEVVVEFRRGVGRGRARGVLRERGLRPSRRMPRSGLHVARLPRGRPVPRAAAGLRSHPAVRDASPNLLRYPQDHFVPNDELFDPHQWGLLNTGEPHGTAFPEEGGGTTQGLPGADIKAIGAWHETTDDPGEGNEVVVAVVDTGVDITHPDIAGNLWVNEDPGSTGCVDDIHGCDFTQTPPDGSSLFLDDPSVEAFDHGTHVAGTIAAVTDNGIGVAGVCPDCKIMVLKIGRPIELPSGEKFMGLDLAAQIEALDYAADNGADVVNASFGAPVIWSGIERRAYRRLQRAGVLAVIAAGNNSGDNDRLMLEDFKDDEFFPKSPMWPATYELPGIISVAASTSSDGYGFISNCPAPPPDRWRCAFTNWGARSVHIAAPGTDILSTVPAGTGRDPASPDYDFFDGTSMAAPHVAGVAGLVKARHPSWTRGQIKRAILNSVDGPLGLHTLEAFPTGNGFPETAPTGRFIRNNGRLNAHAAVARAEPGPGLARFRHDNIARARWIPDTRRGRLAWPRNSNHVYKKRLVRGARYRVVLRGPPGEDFNLWLWRPFARDIWQLEEGCFFAGFGRCAAFRTRDRPGESFARITFRAPSSRVFFIHVNAWLFNRGPYTLRAWRCTRPAPRC